MSAQVSTPADERGVRVETRHGAVRGRRLGGLHVFRGVPYAAPPVGRERLRPPRPPAPWAGERDAGAFAPAAPQQPGAFAAAFGAPEAMAEDCLALNVWTPGIDAGRRPVLVWIHGGGFTSGSGSLPVYDGAALARRGDVVVVSLGYRLGALGWLALPALAREEGGALGNFGLQDQLLALAWVRDHIERFGGDPANVTLFGESAGAMSVGTLLGCPGARGLFRRAILQSGAAHHVHAAADAERVARAFMEELGLAPDDVAALRAAPVAALLAAQKRVLERPLPGLGGLRFQPVVDGRVLPRPPLVAIAEGNAAGVAVLAGTNLDEYKLWGLTDPKARSLDEAALLRRCRRNLPGEHPAGGEIAERVVETYRAARLGRAPVDAPALWFAIESDRIFRYPATRLLELQVPHAPAAHSYLFTWRSPALGGLLGACHALEVPFVFGGVGQPTVSRFTGGGEAAWRLSDAMQAAWLAFARGGDPRHAGLPDWPVYDAGGRRATLLLGEVCAVESAPLEVERSFWEGLL